MKPGLKFCAVILALMGSAAWAQLADLTGEVWSVCGDDGGSTWHDTRLVFTEQTKGAEGDTLVGYFDWKSSGGSFGREHFTGTLSADGALALLGSQLENSQSIITSRYHATLNADGTVLFDGVWLDGVPGIWAAVRDGGKGSGVALCVRGDQLS